VRIERTPAEMNTEGACGNRALAKKCLSTAPTADTLCEFRLAEAGLLSGAWTTCGTSCRDAGADRAGRG